MSKSGKNGREIVLVTMGRTENAASRISNRSSRVKVGILLAVRCANLSRLR